MLNDTLISRRVAAQSAGFTILNAALIGYSSYDYVNVVNHFTEGKYDSFDIKRVTLFYCLNDIYSKFKDRPLPDSRLSNALRSILDFLNQYCRTYLFIKHQILDHSKSYFLYDEQLYDPAHPELMASILDILAINDKCKNLNIEFEVALLPYEYQLRNYSNKTYHKPQILMQIVLREKNIKVYDCMEFLKHYPGKAEDLYMPGDGIHFLIWGHRILVSERTA